MFTSKIVNKYKKKKREKNIKMYIYIISLGINKIIYLKNI